MKLPDILTWALSIIGTMAFLLFYFLYDRQDKKHAKVFLYIAILCAALLIALFIAFFGRSS